MAASRWKWQPVTRSFGLGRGLDALIPGATDGVGSQEIAIDRISRNPHQPRSQFDEAETAELAASIATHGVLQPIIVAASGRPRPTCTPIAR